MTRGRAPNLSLPLTKALAQQRDYRARKAANIARLETENEQLRSENSRLIRQIDGLRQGAEHGEEGQRRLPSSLPPSTSTSSTPASSEANARMLAEYQHLRANYEALEAEVRRKEHVLQVLKDKEREAFARLESLLKQTYDLVGSDNHAHRLASSGIYPMPATIKEETLPGSSTVPILNRHVPYEFGSSSVDQRPSSFTNGQPSGNRDPRLTSDSPFARPIQSSQNSAPGELSVSPDSDTWRAQKRLRSSSTNTMAHVGRPPQVMEYPPVSSEPRVVAHGYPLPCPGTYPTEGSGSALDSQYRRLSYTQLRPISNRYPELTYPRYALENAPSPTHSLSATDTSLRLDQSDRQSTQPLSSLMTPSAPGLSRNNAMGRDEPVAGLRLPQPMATMNPMTREDPYRVGDRLDEVRQWPSGNQELPAIPGMNELGARDHFLQRSASPPLQIFSGGQTSRSGSDIISNEVLRQSAQPSNCGPASRCQPTCQEPSIGAAGPAASNRNCGTPAARSSPLRLELPSIDNLATRPSADRSTGDAASDMPPVSDCCNGLFDCTSLPSSLWMPLHAMSTSYERGNAASRPSADISKADMPLPLPNDGSARPVSPRPSASLLNAVTADLVDAPVKPELDAPDRAVEGKLAGITADEECCFGIVQCDAS